MPLSPTVALMGEFLLHPGVLVGVETPIAGDHLLLAAHAGTYVHVRNHVGARVDLEVGARHTTRSGMFVEGFAGVGYLHTFAASPVWVVEDGAASEIADAGQPSFMPSLTLGTGWQGDRVSPFFRVQAFGQYPLKLHLLPHSALMLGVRG
jgi:hypothetical protein